MINKLSQKQIIVKYLRWIAEQGINDGWVKEYKLRSVKTPFGWIGFQGDRRCRELAREGYLERRYVDGYAEFRYKPKQKIPQPTNEDEELEHLIIATS